jgi:CRP-like cAMP-binding protein
VILEGEVDVLIELPAGPVPMATLGRNRIIGELGVFTDMPRTASVVARSDLVAIRIEQDSLMQISAAHPSIAVAIIRELGGRLASMNRSLAYLTHAAEALGRDEYNAALLDELTSQAGELATFAQAFFGMAAEIRNKQMRRQEMQAAAEIQQSWRAGRRPGASTSMPRCTRRA